MKTRISGVLLFTLLVLGTSHAAAQEKLRIGLIYTLSGPAAVIGQQARDGFLLAVNELGRRMASLEVEVIVVGKVDFVVGPIFAHILQAIHNPVLDSGTFLIGTNSGPSIYAGNACDRNFFVTSYQNDQSFEALGKVAQDRGYKRMYVMVPNYQAGKDAVAGFKRTFKGEILDEAYVPLNNLDFLPELAKIESLKPDALFTFMPGGMCVNLVRQYSQAGLKDRIPFLSAFTVDEATLPAQQDAAIGLFGALTWAPNMDNQPSKKFVAAYEAAYHLFLHLTRCRPTTPPH